LHRAYIGRIIGESTGDSMSGTSGLASSKLIAVLKMTPPMLLLVGVRFEEESSLYFASTLEAEEA
jgi:hypothetical protein